MGNRRMDTIEENDSREKLEADVRKWCGKYAYQADMVWAWLNRQAAITRRTEQAEWIKQANGLIHEANARADELQAKCDELNAAIGNGTCRNVAKEWGEKIYYFVCSECGWNLVNVGRVSIEIAAEMINTCPNCGKKVKR